MRPTPNLDPPPRTSTLWTRTAPYRRAVGWIVTAVFGGLSYLAAAQFETPVDAIAPLMIVVAVLSTLAIVTTGLTIGWRRPLTAGVGVVVAIPAVGYAWKDNAGISCSSFTDVGEIVIAGTLCVPNGVSNAPGVVMIHGQGPETRANGLFYVRFMARRGVAGLAYDKRGTGESGGRLSDGGYQGFADDAIRMLARLGQHGSVDPTRVGFAGWSEGEWVIPLAIERGRPAFTVVVSGSGLSPEAQVRESIRLRLENAGYGEEEVTRAQNVHDLLHEYLRGEPAARFRDALHQARGEAWFSSTGRNLPDSVWPREDYSWWIGVMDLQPGPYWSTYEGHVLWVKGGLDNRSDANQLRARVTNLRGETAPDIRTDFRFHPAAEHGLIEWPRGEGRPPPRWPAGYPAEIAEWIKETTGSRAVGRSGGQPVG